MLSRDIQLQSYLIWLQNKSISLKLDGELGAAVRSFYFAIDVVFDGAMNLESSSLFGVIISNSFQAKFILNDNSEISLDRYLQLTLDRAIDITKNPSFDIKLGFANFRALKLNFKKILSLEVAHEDTFWMCLKELLAVIPNNFNSNEDFNMWWQENGVTWYQLLRSYMIEFRDIGHDWQFSYQQKKLIKQYYDANKLLVDCLNNACPASNAIKKEIEKRLFLPVGEYKYHINVKNG